MHTAGFSLLELLVIIAIFTMVVGLTARVFHSSTRLSAYILQNIEQVEAVETLRTEFAEAVRESAAVHDSLGPYTTGEEYVVLRHPPPENGQEYTVFGRLPGQDALCRLDLLQTDGRLEPLGLEAFSLPCASAVFQYGPEPLDDPRTITLNIEATTNPGQKSKPYLFTASLRCHE